MGWGEAFLWVCGFAAIAAAAAQAGEWLVAGYREIEERFGSERRREGARVGCHCDDPDCPLGRSPRWVNEIRKGQRP